MRATARDLETPGGEMDETIAYARDPESGLQGPNEKKGAIKKR